MNLKEIDCMYMSRLHFFAAWYHMRGLACSDERLQTYAQSARLNHARQVILKLTTQEITPQMKSKTIDL